MNSPLSGHAQLVNIENMMCVLVLFLGVIKNLMASKIKKLLFMVVLLVALLIALVALFYVKSFTTQLADNQEVWGQFGDYFGGVLNPILSFFAFCTLVFTVYLQLQAGADSDKRHDEQLFDGRLFKMLSMNFELARSLRLSVEKDDAFEVYDGLRAINFSWHVLSTKFLQEIASKSEVSDEEVFTSIRLKVKALKRLHGNVISAYVDSAIFILNFIMLYGGSKKQVEFAVHALRAQMTSGGRGLLFYNIICSEQHCDFAMTLMRYSFLDDVTDDPLCDRRNNIYVAASEYYQS